MIVVDCPPLAAGADALALGTLTGNLLLVVRPGSTDRELAAAKLDVVERLPIRILGAVLNDVRASKSYGYYDYYYTQNYLPGYEATEEQDEASLGDYR